MAYSYAQAQNAVFSFDNIRISIEATVSRTLRVNTVTFGDGYTQTIADGLNNEMERWSIKTAPMSLEETWGLESWLLRTRGTPFQWTPPDSTKTLKAVVQAGKIELGYRNLNNAVIDGYSVGTNYTFNGTTGTITAITIPNGTTVSVNISLSPRWYQLNGEWSISELGPSAKVMSFELKRVYV